MWNQRESKPRKAVHTLNGRNAIVYVLHSADGLTGKLDLELEEVYKHFLVVRLG